MKTFLLAFCVAILFAGCGRNKQDEGVDPVNVRDEGVDPPNVVPHEALKLTVEPPAQPIPLRGPIDLKVWLENTCGQPLVICTRLDGSSFIQRPTYEVHLTTATGEQIHHKSYRWCGTRFTLKKTDFLRLRPGEKVDASPFLELMNIWKVTYASEYPTLKPGVLYTLTVTYRMADAKGGWTDEVDDEISAEAAPFFREALRCDITSAPVPVRFSYAQ
jgi:hypothetical protein